MGWDLRPRVQCSCQEAGGCDKGSSGRCRPEVRSGNWAWNRGSWARAWRSTSGRGMSGEGGGLGAEPGRALKFRQRSGGRLEGRLEKQQAARPKDHREPWQPRGTAVLEEAVWTVGAGSLVKGTGRGAVSQRRWRLSLCLPGWRILPAEVGAGEGVTGLPVRASPAGELLREQEARGRGRRGEGGRCPLGWWAGPRCGELSLLEEQLASSSVQAASRLS